MLNNLIFHFGTRGMTNFHVICSVFIKGGIEVIFALLSFLTSMLINKNNTPFPQASLWKQSIKQYSVFTSVLVETEYTPSRPTRTIIWRKYIKRKTPYFLEGYRCSPVLLARTKLKCLTHEQLLCLTVKLPHARVAFLFDCQVMCLISFFTNQPHLGVFDFIGYVFLGLLTDKQQSDTIKRASYIFSRPAPNMFPYSAHPVTYNRSNQFLGPGEKWNRYRSFTTTKMFHAIITYRHIHNHSILGSEQILAETGSIK